MPLIEVTSFTSKCVSEHCSGMELQSEVRKTWIIYQILFRANNIHWLWDGFSEDAHSCLCPNKKDHTFACLSALSPLSPTWTALQRHLLFWIPRQSTSSKLPCTLSQAWDSTRAPLSSIPDNCYIFTFAIVITAEPQRWGWTRIEIHFFT